MSIEWDFKIIRDPLYGYIGLTKDEVAILDELSIQRLRRIKQLAHTYLVYPGATHSRFEHSLGCLYVADKIAQRLKFTDEERVTLRYASLLHDLGHGPYSHVFETILGIANDGNIDHAKITPLIIKNSAISKLLAEYCNPVLDLLSSEPKETILHTLISSSLDVDRLDYLRRDSYYTGVAYGIFDLDRIIHTLHRHSDHYLVVKEKGVGALVNFKIARFSMHDQVYQHHVRAIADTMTTRAAEIAFREGSLRVEDLQLKGTDTNNFLRRFLELDDASFMERLYVKNTNAARLALMLKDRKLLKVGYKADLAKLDIRVFRALSKMTKSQFLQMEEEIAKATNTEKDFVIVYLQRIDNPLYKDPDRYLDEKEGPIDILMDDGTIHPFEEISPMTGASTKYVRRLYIFCPPEGKESVKVAAEKYLEALKE